jgi:hypothetical protein
MIDGRIAPSKRRPDWIDPVVRLAVEVYWRRRRSVGAAVHPKAFGRRVSDN